MTRSYEHALGRPPRNLTPIVIALTAVAAFGCRRGPESGQTFPPGSQMNERRYATLQAEASEDLQCPAEALTYAYRGDGFHTMSGCNQSRDYLMYCVGMSCRWMPPPYEEAAFAISCDPSAMSAVPLAQNKIGMTGCDQRLVYVAHCSAASGWGHMNCSWLLEGSATTNTIATEPPPPPPPPVAQ